MTPPAPDRWRPRRLRGVVAIALGLLATVSPLVVGEWAIGVVGLALLASGVLELVQALRSDDPRIGWSAYAGGGLSILAGLLMFMRPLLVLSGLLVVASALFLVDGSAKVVAAVRSGERRGVRGWALVNGPAGPGEGVAR